MKFARDVFAVCATAALAVSTAHGETQTVKLGLAGPMTGPQAQYGKDFQSGVLLAIDDFNATKPVIDGKLTRFTLESADDQADPKTGMVVSQKLLDDGIKGMFGPFNSGVAIPASALFARAGIPQISLATAPAFTRQGYKTTFRMLTSDTQQGGAMGRYVVQVLKVARIAIIDDRTAYGQGLAEEFEKSARAAGGNVVAHEFTTDKSVDFKGVLTSVKSKNPDFIYYAGADAQSAPMVKQARELAVKAVFASGEMSKTEQFLKIAGKASDGVIVSLAGLPLEKMPGGSGYAERYKAKFGTSPTTYSPYSYDGAMAMMRSMQNANSSDPEKYLPDLKKVSMRGVTTNDFSYDENGDLKETIITVYKSVNGQWVPETVLGGK